VTENQISEYLDKLEDIISRLKEDEVKKFEDLLDAT
jgi:hypothetical protein